MSFWGRFDLSSSSPVYVFNKREARKMIRYKPNKTLIPLVPADHDAGDGLKGPPVERIDR